MPELPEVEVTRRQIRRALVGRRVTRVDTTRPSYFFLTRPAELRERLMGRRVERLERVGKYLLAGLDDGSRLLLHLGMTGQLFSAGAESPRLVRKGKDGGSPDPHTHLVLGFEDSGPLVFFRDVRKFGKVLWLAPGESHERLEKLGVDALRSRPEDLWEATRQRKVPIKTLLLDQGVLAGVGNIYADEALFLAGVKSTRPSRRVTREECARIIEEIHGVLDRAIALGGSSVRDYVRPDGSDGSFQEQHYVYARTGEPCRRCGTVIKRIVLGQRAAHYCPCCQK